MNKGNICKWKCGTMNFFWWKLYKKWWMIKIDIRKNFSWNYLGRNEKRIKIINISPNLSEKNNN